MKRHLLPIFIIVTTSMVIYANTLKNGFVYDDAITILNNTFITDIINLTKLFDSKAYLDNSGEETYRPVVTLSYFIDYALFGLKPMGYHLINILLHGINGILAYTFLQLILRPSSTGDQNSTFARLLNNPPLIASLLFLTHPALTEAVNAISFREDLLVSLFYMITLIIYLYIRSITIVQTHRFFLIGLVYVFSSLFYLLALFSKEMALTLPLILLCYEWIYAEKKVKGKLLANYYIIGYIVITLLYLYIRFWLFDKPINSNNIWYWPLVERLLTVPWLISKYIFLLLAPFNLSAEYIIAPVKSISSPAFILSLLPLASISMIMLMVRERNILFGALFFIISFIPVYNIFPLDNPIAERYLYLPSLGFAIITGSVVGKIKSSTGNNTGNKYLIPSFVISFIVLLIIFSLSTLERNTVWKDNKSLWSDTLKKAPYSPRAHNNLGMAYATGGRLNEAIKEYLTALKLEPYYPNAHYNLGVAYTKQGRLDEAITEYLIALNVKPDDANIHHDLGFIYAELDRHDDAIKEYLKALKLKPSYPNAHRNLGIAYVRQAQLDKAMQALTIALNLQNDDIIARYMLGRVYMNIGLKGDARRELGIIIKQSPGFIEARRALETIDKK